MLWIYFTLLAVLIWTVVNIVDKHVITEHIKQPRIAVIFLAIMSLVAAIVVLLTTSVIIPSIDILLISFIAGILYIAETLLYYKSVLIEEVSRVLPMYSIAPIFVLILSTIFLGEIFTPIKYVGIILIVVGAVLISLRKDVKFTVSKALLFMVAASLILGVYYVLLKYITLTISFWDAFFWTRIGSGLMIPFLIIALYKPLKETIKRTPRGIAYLCGNETLNVIGVFIFLIATSIGFISLVSAMGATEPLFVLFFASLLSFYRPKILSEELKKSVIALKVIAIAMIIIGAILII